MRELLHFFTERYSMDDLNSQQMKAVRHVQGPLLVLAGAGSGKTRVITQRVAHLLEIGVLPSQILAVTFTNKAAEEMRHRIRMLKNEHVLACTFHSLGARMLRESIHHLGYENTFAIYDEEDSEKLLKSCLEEIGISDTKSYLKETRLYISGKKNDLAEPMEGEDVLDSAYRLYQKKLKDCNAVDFDDLLFLTVQLLQKFDDVREAYQNRWLFLLIDEYQDTNLAQYTLAKILCDKHQNIFAVGDPDQSIYSWRGARYQNILNFETDFKGAEVITLDQNYRSTNTILKAANAVIGHNDRRFKKELWSELGEGSKIGLYLGFNEKQEAQFVASEVFKRIHFDDVSPNDIAIFYRTNAQSRTFEDALLSKKIPYTIIGGVSFYERKEIKDILAYLRVAVSNFDLISFLRTIQIPRRGLGAATVDKMVAGANERQMPIIKFCEELLDFPAVCPDVKLGNRQKEGLRNYLRTIYRLRDLAPKMKICELIKEVISETNYLSLLQEDPETAQERKENIDELLGKAAEWEEEHLEPSIAKFLEELSLRVPLPNEGSAVSVKMMTLHNSKGLEFSAVFFVGLEEDLLPHINSKDDPSAIEEERRLCYVGMTRAKKSLCLSLATYRYMWGTERLMRPSRFLKEIPSEFTISLSKPRSAIPTETNFFQ